MVAVIAFSLFIDYFLYGMFLTLAAHSPSGLQTEAQMAWLYGAYAASALVITPLVGYIGTRTGGRTVMVCGLTLAACATALFGFASDLQVLFLGRLFEGAASAALWTAGLSLVAAHYTENRVEMIGYAFTGSTAGSVLGPIAGGLLSHIGGYRLPFLVTGLLIAVAFVGILSICPRGERSRPENLNLRAVLMNKALIPPALVIAAAAFAVGLLEPLLPVRWAREGMTSETTGLIYTVSTLVYGFSAPLVGRCSNRFSIINTMTIGATAMAASLPLLAVFRQAGLVGLAVSLVYVSFAFMLNPASAELGNVVDRAGLVCYSAAYALYNVVYSLGMLAVALIAPAAAGALGLFGTLLCGSVVVLLCIPFLVLIQSPDATLRGAPAGADGTAQSGLTATSSD